MSETVSDPKQELDKLFRKLEKRIDAAAETIVRLRAERDALARKLAESERVRREAVGRLDTLIDSVEGLR
jgi:phage shock protein A